MADAPKEGLIAYAWYDLAPGVSGKIVPMVSFERPCHIPAECISVLQGPQIPKSDLSAPDTP